MKFLKITTICLFLFTVTANAKEHEVKMLTSGENGETMVFEPAFIKIEKGDSINFVPSDPSHNAQSMSTTSDKLAFNTPMGKTAKVTFNDEGVVLYKCLPHFALGMVGVIQVGNYNDTSSVLSDWNAVKAGVVMNKERMNKYLGSVK
ncbi:MULTISPECIES: plastocyanin/azurin family copper-binding protein [unclassified Pseudoalteromonas]|jgi:pseudoazurin|uniref:plastocyanin/azurin family copper-binding protein n=1 Tax=unclassified Pseudoalteromonas TaxID=194690 RepID=UPI0005A9DD9B|nr:MULTISPECIES: plastocyanin/azurin family copper-binding protein [unclassified Pseudoalteromonas]